MSKYSQSKRKELTVLRTFILRLSTKDEMNLKQLRRGARVVTTPNSPSNRPFPFLS